MAILEELNRRLDGLLTKFNTCHSSSTGQFCSTSGGAGGGGGASSGGRTRSPAEQSLRDAEDALDKLPATALGSSIASAQSTLQARYGRGAMSSEVQGKLARTIDSYSTPLKTALRDGRTVGQAAMAHQNGNLVDFTDIMGRRGFNSEKMRDFADKKKLTGAKAIDGLVSQMKTDAGVKRFRSYRGY